MWETMAKEFLIKFGISIDRVENLCYTISCCWTEAADAGVAQPVEQLICNQQVGGSNPSTSSTISYLEEFPSGQRGQTVNLLRFASVVRIHPPPPRRRVLHIVRDDVFFFKANAISSSFRRSSLSKPNPLRWASVWGLATSFFKTRRALILLLLAFTAQTLRWFARRWMRGCCFFIKTSSARFLAPPDPNRTRCAGLRFGQLAVSSVCSEKSGGGARRWYGRWKDQRLYGGAKRGTRAVRLS